MENVSVANISIDKLAMQNDKYTRILEVNITSGNESQLIGFSAKFSTRGKIYSVDCILHSENGDYYAPSKIYSLSGYYLASCDLRSLWNEQVSVLYLDPSNVRFDRRRNFAISLEFFVEPNTTVYVRNVRAYLYHSDTPTNFAIFETPRGYMLKIEPFRFSFFNMEFSGKRNVIIEIRGSKNENDLINVTFDKYRCDWEEYKPVGVQFLSADPRFHVKGTHLFSYVLGCEGQGNDNSWPYKFDRKWAVVEGVYINHLDNLKAIAIKGTLYDPPTERDELREWLRKFLLVLGIGILIGIGIQKRRTIRGKR